MSSDLKANCGGSAKGYRKLYFSSRRCRKPEKFGKQWSKGTFFYVELYSRVCEYVTGG